MSAVKKLFGIRGAQVVLALLLAAACFFYLRSLERTSAWLHIEQATDRSYTVGTINFRLYDTDEVTLPYSLVANAPTRYFVTGEHRPAGDAARDANFSAAVTVHQIRLSNSGNIPLNASLSVTDSTLGSGFYYVLVPIDAADANYTQNFATQRYREYLDNVFSTRPTHTDAERRAAVDAVNAAALLKISNIRLVVGQSNVPLCYILFWPEYDNTDWGTAASLAQAAYEVQFTVRADQDNIIP